MSRQRFSTRAVSGEQFFGGREHQVELCSRRILPQHKKKSEDRWEETGSERERERANQNINNPEKSETLEVMVERKVLTLKKKKGTLKIFNFFDNLFKITLNVFFLTITWL